MRYFVSFHFRFTRFLPSYGVVVVDGCIRLQPLAYLGVCDAFSGPSRAIDSVCVSVCLFV